MPPIADLEAIRRNQILEAAQKTIAAAGCANVTMEDVANAAGLSKGGLAHYFPSKRELFKAVFERFFERIFDRSQKTMAGCRDPLDKLLSLGWLYEPDDPDTQVGYPILFDFMSIAVHDADYRAIFHQWIDNWIKLLHGPIREGVQKGLFRRLEPDQTARTVSAIYQGIATRWYLAPQSHPRQWALDSFRRAITNLLIP
jgi:AcrR family transcriptional regulator